MASGFNVIDFMDLPGFERCIVRFILRETEMSYPQLCEAVTTIPAEQKVDGANLDRALDHLTRSQWLIRQGDEKQSHYRVNSLQRTTSQNQSIWDDLQLESLDQSRSYQIDLEPAENSLKRGGKRTLPAHIWECLTDPEPEERMDKTPLRRTGLLNKLAEDDGRTKTE